MLCDPIRQASLAAAQATDGGPPLDADAAAPIAGQTSFDELLRALNPLHHLPVVGTIYRAVTGETIQPAYRVLGGALFGGVGGMLTSAVGALLEEFRPMQTLGAAWRGETPAATLRQAQSAYGMFNGNGA